MSQQASYVPGALAAPDSTHQNKFYTAQLNLRSACDLMKSKQVFVNALQMDGVDDFSHFDPAEMRKFLASNQVCGRAETIARIKRIGRAEDTLAIVSGGRNTGKTKIMNNIAALINSVSTGGDLSVEAAKAADRHGMTLVVNGRMAGSSALDKCILAEMAAEWPIIHSVARSAVECAADSNSQWSKRVDVVALNALLNTATTTDIPLQLLVIDEANRFFNREADRHKQLQTLQLFVAYGKEKSRFSTILCSTDFNFPSMLNELGFSFKYIDKQVVIGDPSPADALATIKSWGVGTNLASALVDVFGGHLRLISRELLDLQHTPIDELMTNSVTFGYMDTFSIRKCLVEEAREVETSQFIRVMSKTLRALAETGFAPRPPDLSENVWQQLIDDLLTRHRIAGYVDPAAFAEHIPNHIRKGSNGLVPDTQFTRMLLVREFGERWMHEDNAKVEDKKVRRLHYL